MTDQMIEQDTEHQICAWDWFERQLLAMELDPAVTQDADDVVWSATLGDGLTRLTFVEGDLVDPPMHFNSGSLIVNDLIGPCTPSRRDVLTGGLIQIFNGLKQVGKAIRP